MAKKVKNEASFELPFTKQNYFLFFVGLIIIALGFYLQSIGPADSFESRTLAPIVLVFGYLVVLPVAILWREKKEK